LNIVLEPLMGWLSGRPGPVNGSLVRAATFLVYSLQPVPEALWIAYLYTRVRREAALTKRQWLGFALPLALPLTINLLASMISLSNGLMFSIGEDNVYHRGPYYPLMSVTCYSYLLYYFCYALFSRKQMLQHEFEMFFLGALPTVLAGVIQVTHQGLMVIWQAASFTMLIFYMYILTHQANTDPLTGLANRRRFDNYLNTVFSADGGRAVMALILVDIDNFKSINDRYGHLMGDRVLEAVGGALRRSARKRDLVARLGGDEFAMLAEVHESRDLSHIAGRVRENLRAVSQRSGFPFPIETSVGCGSCGERADLTPEKFIEMIDNRMYDEKRVNHRRARGEPQPAASDY
jgi:diguanylate cyclase (GGDEF)-like protein